MKKSLCFFLLILLLASPISAHPGRTDSNGGHWVWTEGWGYEVGTYHYHDGSNSGSRSSSGNEKTQSAEPLYPEESENKWLQKVFAVIARIYVLVLFSPLIYALLYFLYTCITDFISEHFPPALLKQYEKAVNGLKASIDKLNEMVDYPEGYEDSLIPADCRIGEDGLPEDLTSIWEDKYTLYISGNGKKLHKRYACHNATSAVHIYSYYKSPYIDNLFCSVCCKNYKIPPLDWYEDYLRIQNERKARGKLISDISKSVYVITSLDEKLNQKHMLFWLTPKQKRKFIKAHSLFIELK